MNIATVPEWLADELPDDDREPREHLLVIEAITTARDAAEALAWAHTDLIQSQYVDRVTITARPT